MSREIKFQILWVRNLPDFTKVIETHYTTLDRLTSGADKFNYSQVEVVAKRQSTGLKDKNGVEIYEGDIVHHWKQGNRVVVYPMSPTYAGFGVVSSDGMKNVLSDSVNLYEVIGNIHQNPELLNE